MVNGDIEFLRAKSAFLKAQTAQQRLALERQRFLRKQFGQRSKRRTNPLQVFGKGLKAVGGSARFVSKGFDPGKKIIQVRAKQVKQRTQQAGESLRFRAELGRIKLMRLQREAKSIFRRREPDLGDF